MNTLIKNALTVLPDGGARVTNVCVKGDEIFAVGDIPRDFFADETIDGDGRLLIPGLVNAHTHAYMTVLRNKADDLPFMDWLFKNVMPMESRIKPEDAYWSTLYGIMEMLRGGVTSFCDMHLYEHAVAQAAADCHMRAVLSRGIVGSEEEPEAADIRLKEARADIAEFAGIPELSFMIAPHAPYTCSELTLRKCAEAAKELGVGIHSHLSESESEQKQIREKYGISPAELYDRCGLLTDNTVLAHCVQLSESDMEILAKRGASIALCPVSNMKLGNGFAPVKTMLEKGVNLGLGTDSAASNNSLRILREMQFTALIHKGVNKNAECVSGVEVFNMATAGGARACGFKDVGTIAVGSKADLALFELDVPELMPMGEPRTSLCYSGESLMAETVMVNGRVLLHKGEFRTIDAERAAYELKSMNERLYGKGTVL